MYRILLFLLLLPFVNNAQEVLTGLHINQVQYQNSLLQKQEMGAKAVNDTVYYFIYHPVSLPFIDDFSTNKINNGSHTNCLPWIEYVKFKVGLIPDTIFTGRLEPSIRTILTQTATSTVWTETTDTLPFKTVYFFVYAHPETPIDTVKYYPTYSQIDSVYFDTSLAIVSKQLYTYLDTVILVNEFKRVIKCYETGNPLWTDNNVYLNSHYPIQPPTVGVATFDGADSHGVPYDWSVVPNYLPHGIADYLTSLPIDMSALEETDSTVYFSFYFQPQGRGGNVPQNIDSLLLQFKINDADTLTDTWKTVWYSEGFGLGQDNATSEEYRFKYVSFKVDTAYYYKGFQFRFLNYATLTGAVDQWHLDFVRLDKNRSAGDSAYIDRAFVYPHKSLLKEYQNIPYTHYSYRKNLGFDMLHENLNPYIHNLRDVQANTRILAQLSQRDNTSQVETVFNTTIGSSSNVKPSNYCQVGVDCKDATTNETFLIYGMNTEFPAGSDLEDTGQFNLTLIIDSVFNDLNYENDTVRTAHNFYNYYAYDDGTAENGYGLNVLDGQISMRYKIYKPDTLQAVAMYFDPQTINFFTDDSPYMFTLQVYSGSDRPETLLYEEDSLKVKFGTTHFYSRINDFAYYFLKPVNYISPYTNVMSTDSVGHLFIGIKQQTAQVLGLGFDRNNNSNENMFYNIQDGAGWYQSQLPGSWMMRPCFGEPFTTPIGINESPEKPEFVVVPNPAQESFSLYSSEFYAAATYEVRISDLSGRLVLKGNTLQNISLADLESGVYTVNVLDNSGTNFGAKKLVVMK